jgi:murein DD-endopeptidase MepM/ murein hydrolase activator NlpD
MTRLGWRLLLLFAVVIAGFALVVRRTDFTMTTAGPKPAPQAAPRSAVSVPAPVTIAVPTGQGLVIPVSGMMPNQLSDTWGQSRAAGVREHHAIDIIAPRGTPVIAAAAGRVEKIFESKDGGHTVYIRRTDPAWVDYYAHLDTYVAGLTEGLPVKAGQQIGTVGFTGNASPDGPHLHYEIKQMAPGEKWYQGTNINPYRILHGG